MTKKIVLAFGAIVLLIGYLILRDRFVQEISFVGTIETTRLDLPARLATTVKSFAYEEGDSVESGKVLVSFDCEEIKIREQRVQTEFSRAKRLLRSGSLTQETFDKVETEKAELDLKLSWCQIVSPIEGVVLTRYLDPNEWVTPGTKVISIANLNEIWTYIYVDQTFIPNLKLGMKINGTLPGYEDRVILGKIAKINSEAEFTPKTAQTLEERARLVFGVKVQLEQVEQLLKPGMSIKIEFPDSKDQ